MTPWAVVGADEGIFCCLLRRRQDEGAACAVTRKRLKLEPLWGIGRLRWGIADNRISLGRESINANTTDAVLSLLTQLSLVLDHAIGYRMGLGSLGLDSLNQDAGLSNSFDVLDSHGVPRGPISTANPQYGVVASAVTSIVLPNHPENEAGCMVPKFQCTWTRSHVFQAVSKWHDLVFHGPRHSVWHDFGLRCPYASLPPTGTPPFTLRPFSFFPFPSRCNAS